MPALADLQVRIEEDEAAESPTTLDSVDLVEAELLVEEISIDGMCGVY